MASNDWPKRRTERQDIVHCVVCRKPILSGQLYHYITHKGRKYVHAACYEKEVHPNDGSGA